MLYGIIRCLSAGIVGGIVFLFLRRFTSIKRKRIYLISGFFMAAGFSIIYYFQNVGFVWSFQFFRYSIYCTVIFYIIFLFVMAVIYWLARLCMQRTLKKIRINGCIADKY